METATSRSEVMRSRASVTAIFWMTKMVTAPSANRGITEVTKSSEASLY